MLGNNSSIWYRRRGTIIVAGLLLVAGAVVAYMRWFGSRGDASTVSAATAIPSAEVIRGELVDIVELRGQIRPLHSVDLLAPPDAGAIQILKLVKDGDTVKKGDVVIVFDPSTIQMTLNQRSSDLKQAEAQVDDARAKQKLAEQQDLTDLQKANYNVERAKLDASQAEILSEIDGEEKKLALADAEQKAKQVQQKLDSDRASNKADLSNIDQKRKKAQLDVQHTKTLSPGSLFMRPPTAWFTLCLTGAPVAISAKTRLPSRKATAPGQWPVSRNCPIFPRFASPRTLTKKIAADCTPEKPSRLAWTPSPIWNSRERSLTSVHSRKLILVADGRQ